MRGAWQDRHVTDPQRTPRSEPLASSRQIARLLDDAVTVPGTKVGVGFDAVLGLIPGIGDLLGSALSGAIMYDAVDARVPIPVLARMGWNILIDAGLGLIPFAGDLADVAHRANRKNYRLLERALAESSDPAPPSRGYLIAAALLTILPLLISVAIAIAIIVWLITRLA